MNDTPSEGRYELLRALYDFTNTTHYAKSLNFHIDDLFIIYEISTKKRQWWEVVNGRGEVGYVPSNYVSTVEVTLKYLIQFLEGSIAVLHNEQSKVGQLPSDRQRLLNFLLEKKRKAEVKCENSGKRRAPHPAETKRPSASDVNLGCGDGDMRPHGATNASASTHNDCNFKEVTFTKSTPSKVITKRISTPMQQLRISSSEPFKQLENDAVQVSAQKKVASSTEVKTVAHENHVRLSSQPKTTFQNNVDHDSHLSTKEDLQTMHNNASSNHVASSPNADSNKACTLPATQIAYNLVQQVRHHTKLSHDLSQLGVAVVVTYLRDLMTTDGSQQCLDDILMQCQGRLEAPRHLIEETYDGSRLHVIFTELTSCKDDSQQRSWMLHEDEATIIEYLNELTSILTNADPSICRHMMSLDHYNAVNSLIQYYQMEVRWTIRTLLLRTFGAMCHLDGVVVTLMLNSVLPMELARDMQTNVTDVPRLLFSSLLLIMLFSMGESMPVAHNEYLGPEFASFLFQSVENPPETDVEDQIPDKFIHLLLAYNLQFTDSQSNYMLQALEERENAKTFTEKILVLFVREEDPVRIFDHTPDRPNSVLKLFLDLFSRPKTAILFYTNDVKVLIDNIARQLADLSPGDKRRREYLLMCQLVMRNSTYHEHQHRCSDIRQCFTRIFCEESEESADDQRLVRAISNEFPQYFKQQPHHQQY